MRRTRLGAIWIPIMLLVVALPSLQAGTITASCSDFSVAVPYSGLSTSSCGQFDPSLGGLTSLQFMGFVSGMIRGTETLAPPVYVSTGGFGADLEVNTTLTDFLVEVSGWQTCDSSGCSGYFSSSYPVQYSFRSPAFTGPTLLQTAAGTGDWSPSLSTEVPGSDLSDVTGAALFVNLTVEYTYSDAPPPSGVPEPGTLITLASGIALLAAKAWTAAGQL